MHMEHCCLIPILSEYKRHFFTGDSATRICSYSAFPPATSQEARCSADKITLWQRRREYQQVAHEFSATQKKVDWACSVHEIEKLPPPSVPRTFSQLRSCRTRPTNLGFPTSHTQQYDDLRTPPASIAQLKSAQCAGMHAIPGAVCGAAQPSGWQQSRMLPYCPMQSLGCSAKNLSLEEPTILYNRVPRQDFGGHSGLPQLLDIPHSAMGLPRRQEAPPLYRGGGDTFNSVAVSDMGSEALGGKLSPVPRVMGMEGTSALRTGGAGWANYSQPSSVGQPTTKLWFDTALLGEIQQCHDPPQRGQKRARSAAAEPAGAISPNDFKAPRTHAPDYAGQQATMHALVHDSRIRGSSLSSTVV